MAMTKEQWAEFEKDLDGSMFGGVDLLCDGFRVSFHRREVSKNTLGILVYVNGWFKGIWLARDQEHPERQFYRPCEKYVFPKKFREDMLKIMGKRRYAKDKYDQKKVIYYHYWTSATALRRHLQKTCKEISRPLLRFDQAPLEAAPSQA